MLMQIRQNVPESDSLEGQSASFDSVEIFTLSISQKAPVRERCICEARIVLLDR